MSRLQRIVASLGLGLSLCSGAAAAELAAVVSARVPVTSITQTQLADIYLGRASRFPDGTPAVPCDLPEGSPLREAFYSKVVGKSASQMRAHWSKIIFTGRGQPPREVRSAEEAKRLVIEQPGVVCYIDHSLVDRNVTVLLVQ
ncbi:MAG TPA: phosphate ABC transporter substrate-binding protein [Burkholderiales bacterium]|nr:phosphate ABC transporter substrate-binding protein [Burkholderiales bacterium]